MARGAAESMLWGWLRLLALTKKTDYALIALSLLARRSGAVVSARAMAEQSGVSVAMLTNILKALNHAGVVASERGVSGGYRLARSPESINLHEVITAIEGQVRFVRCLQAVDEAEESRCGLEPSCPVRTPAQKMDRRLREFFESMLLSELLATESEPDLVPVIELGLD